MVIERKPEYFLGLDLGQVSDPTALAIVERRERIYAVRYLHRYERGTPYIGTQRNPGIVELVRVLCCRPPIPGSTLVIDQTGVGRPVVDSFRAIRAAVGIVPVTITSGHNARSEPDGSWHTPKKDLAGCVQMLLQSNRLLIAAELQEADILRRELHNFKVKITTAANEVFGTWREGEHDDLVLAVALACWVAESAHCAPENISVGKPSVFAQNKRL